MLSGVSVFFTKLILCRAVLGLFLSFGGEMDVLHPAVSDGWLNAAANADLACGWGL